MVANGGSIAQASVAMLGVALGVAGARSTSAIPNATDVIRGARAKAGLTQSASKVLDEVLDEVRAMPAAQRTKASIKKKLGACFVAGTPVLMADGSQKPIEEVREGDSVLSRDEHTGDPGAASA